MVRKTNAELKLMARRILIGKYGVVIGAIMIFYVLIMAVSFGGQMIYMATSIGSMMAGYSVGDEMGAGISYIVMSVTMSFMVQLFMLVAEYLLIPGFMKLFLNICTGEPYQIGDLFFAFKHHPWKYPLLGFVIWLLCMVLCIPFIILLVMGAAFSSTALVVAAFLVLILLYVVMIILMLNLAMAYYIIVDDPEIGVIQCVKESFRMMKGNKGRFFVLGLSFIGVYLLGMCSFGLGMLWVIPYSCTTITYFYLELREERGKSLNLGWQGQDTGYQSPADYQNPV